jgi:vancomycin resistance protein YoaR
VATQSFSVRTLSKAQRHNLIVAARHLDGWVIPPGDSFSFNRVVGPRTVRRGYQAAPSYLGGDSPATIGGGICLVSSAIYQVALAANLPITQRVPHLRTIHSVPPGLDATVWYGGADLRFENNLSEPLRLSVVNQDQTLTVRLWGAHADRPPVIHRQVHRRSASEILVTVFRDQRMISRDLYRLTP